MEAFNGFFRIRFGRIGRALATSLALLSLPAIAVAGPPILFAKEYSANRSYYKRVAKACNISPSYSKKDSVFRYAEGFFYRSDGHCLNTGEWRYCATYFVDKPENPKCLGIFYTTGPMAWPRLFGFEPNMHLDSIVLATPIGNVAVLMRDNELTVHQIDE